MSTAAVQTTVETRTPTLKLRSGQMQQRPTPPKFATKEQERQYKKERLAAAFRILAKRGFVEGAGGHITLRDPILTDCFWVNPYAKHFSQMTASDLLLINHKGEVIMGGKPGNGQLYNAAAWVIHGSIHEANPQVTAACHSHTLHGRAMATLGRNIEVTSTDAANFSENVVLYPHFDGVVLDQEEGRRLSGYIGENGRGLILQNHGILTVGDSVDSAIAAFIELEHLCEAQLAADTAGKPLELDEDLRKSIFNERGSQYESWLRAQPLFEEIDVETKSAYKA